MKNKSRSKGPSKMGSFTSKFNVSGVYICVLSKVRFIGNKKHGK
jgi:hypothetical protein